MNSSTETDVFETFKTYLEDEGLRLTQEREEIARTVFEQEDHFEAEELLYEIRRHEKNVSRATIYRTLELLVQSGQVQKIDFGDGYSLYEVSGNRERHGHLYCKQCGEVIEFTIDDIKSREEEVCDDHDFLPVEFRHQIHGYCSNCREVVDLN